MQTYLSATRRMVALLSFALLSCACCRIAAAQRDPVEYKTQSMSVFGGFAYNTLGYTPGSASGVDLGFDLTQHLLRVPLAFSLQARANIVYGVRADEHTYVFGPRVEYRFGRYHPYADFELGLGNIHFKPVLHKDYYGDKSAIVVGGGGVNIRLRHNLAANVDFQVQHWDINPVSHETFVPALATVGLTYTLPFRPLHRSGDPHY